ncbi:hypothetical protein K469DRAFT_567989, partial [Zopfia rhizophila CBS 207.26]
NILAVQGIVGILTGFYILFIPMRMVVALYLPLGRKISVCAVFLTGLLASLCSIVGTIYRFKARPSPDTLWETIPAYTLGSEGGNPSGGSDEQKLSPTIPKPTMTGLLSFIRKTHRSQAPQSTDLTSYDELNLVNDDYHAQLKATQTQTETKPASKGWNV